MGSSQLKIPVRPGRRTGVPHAVQPHTNRAFKARLPFVMLYEKNSRNHDVTIELNGENFFLKFSKTFSVKMVYIACSIDNY
jgi:hypothetical protein